MRQKNTKNSKPSTTNDTVRKKRFADEDIQDAEFKDIE
jgi:hypothetical protein